MSAAVVFKKIVAGSNKLACLHKLQFIHPRLFQSVSSTRYLQFQVNKDSYPCGYEARRYFSRKNSARTPPTKPIVFPNSGELDSSLECLSPSDPKPGFDVPELESCDEAVKKIFSIGFADGRVVKQQRIENILNQVKEHPADVASLEVKIAKMTVEIRTQMKHLLSCRKDKLSKRMLFERLQKRRSWINDLRKIDMEKFDWLLKELKIKYIPYEEFNLKLGKRAQAKKAARDTFLAVKRKKLGEFREKLEKEREAFDEIKSKELETIEKELKALGLGKLNSLQHTVDALKHGKELGPKVKRKVKNRELLLAKKFEMYRHRREESLKD